MNAAPPQRRRWLRRIMTWLTVLAMILVVLFAMVTLPSGWRVYRLRAERDALLAELDRDHPGWRWDDLVPARVPDEVNGALKVMEIAKHLPRYGWGLHIPEEIEDAQPPTHLRPHARYTKEYIAYLGQVLEKYPIARERFLSLAGVTTGNYGWDHAVDTGEGGVNRATSRASGVPCEAATRVHSYLKNDFEWSLGTGNGDRAAQLLRALVGYARTWNRYPTISTGGGHHRGKYYYWTHSYLLRFFAQAEAKPETLRLLSKDLEPIRSEMRDRWFFATEIAMLHLDYEQQLSGLLDKDEAVQPITAPTLTSFWEWLDNLLKSDGKRKSRAMLLREHIVLLRFYRDVGGLRADQRQAVEYFDKHLDTPEIRKSDHPVHELSYDHRSWEIQNRHHAEFEEENDHLRVALACEIYRLEQGRWPTVYRELQEMRDATGLLPPHLPTPPRFQRVGDGLIVYWGEPKDPQNIQVERYFDESGFYRPAPDRGVKLLDPAKRR